MKQTISYSDLPRAEADVKALADIQEYTSPNQWEVIMEAVDDPTTTIAQLNVYFGILGVSGYPVHAFFRKYRLADYRAWMAEGTPSIATDEEGFRLA